jgi:hypothetical protein
VQVLKSNIKKIKAGKVETKKSDSFTNSKSWSPKMKPARRLSKVGSADDDAPASVRWTLLKDSLSQVPISTGQEKAETEKKRDDVYVCYHESDLQFAHMICCYLKNNNICAACATRTESISSMGSMGSIGGIGSIGSSTSSSSSSGNSSAPLMVTTDDLYEQNAEGIETAKVFVFVVSLSSISDERCGEEVCMPPPPLKKSNAVYV